MRDEEQFYGRDEIVNDEDRLASKMPPLQCGVCSGAPVEAHYELVKKTAKYLIYECVRCHDQTKILLKPKKKKR